MVRVGKQLSAVILIVTGGWIGASAGGCTEQPVSEPYPEALGDGQLLLPTGSLEYSADILPGRAEIKDYEPPAEEAVDEEPDDDAAAYEAEAADDAEKAEEAGDAGEPPAARFANAGPASEDVATAIRQAWNDFKAAEKELRQDDMPDYLVEEDRELAEAVFPAEADFMEALQSLRDDYADVIPNTAQVAKLTLAAIEQQAQETLGEIRMMGPDRAIGELKPAQPMMPTMYPTFERSGDTWLIRTPIRFTMAEAKQMASLLGGVADALNGIMEDVDADELDDQAATVKMSQMLQQMATSLQPIVTQAIQRSIQSS